MSVHTPNKRRKKKLLDSDDISLGRWNIFENI